VAGNSSTSDKSIVVSVSKFDGIQHRTWPAQLVQHDGPLLVLDAIFQDDIEHDLLGHISKGTLSTEYYWTDRWYNVFRFSEPDSTLRNFYCNVNLPPTFDGQVLSYVDLDIDVLVSPDFSYTVLDADDFEENARLFSYPQDVIDNSQKALAEIINLIESRQFPFFK
jgi:uncharacterized protein